jgi:hypothetical protein
MSGYRHILLLALAVLVGAAILGGALRQLTGASVHHSATHPAAPTAASALWSPDGPIPPAIHATVRRSLLAVTLLVTPVGMGPARFVATVKERDRRVSDGCWHRPRTAHPSCGSTSVLALRCAPCSRCRTC